MHQALRQLASRLLRGLQQERLLQLPQKLDAACVAGSSGLWLQIMNDSARSPALGAAAEQATTVFFPMSDAWAQTTIGSSVEMSAVGKLPGQGSSQKARIR